MKRLILLLATLTCGFATGPAGAQSLESFTGAFPPSMKAAYNVQVAMRDGVHLSTDVYLPEPDGTFPTLLVRDMYSNGSNALRQRYARFATANGYAFVFQSVRGRYDSEGKWYPYFQEIDDGDDTLTWIAEQPWSNARVGMFGSSYLGSVQWLAALSGNPALKAIAPAVSPGNYYRDVAYPGGAFSLLSRARWGIGLSGSRTNMTYPIDWVSAIDHLPLETLAASVGFDVPHFQDWLDHPSYDDYWKPLNLEARAPEMSVPALNIGGWYDVFQRSTIGSYQTMLTEAATEAARTGQRLVIGPWTHGWNQGTTIGDVDFGPDAEIAVEPLLLEWFDHWLKDGPVPAAAPIRIFVMGENTWRDESAWPLADMQETSFYLHGDGTLSTSAPAAGAEPLEYVYDPADPVPTLGGNIMEPSLRGPHDQGPLDGRSDILRFTSAPFSEPTEITGPIRAELHAASSAPDTDFMAKLVVLRPDGTSFNLVDGVIRARYREGFETPRLITPNEILRYELDLWATSYLIAPGERLRIDITSSNFPRLARNLNTGAEFARTSEFVAASQQIHVSAAHPSRVILPIVPRDLPQEAVSFNGKPLYRFSMAALRIEQYEAKIADVRSRSELTEADYIELGSYHMAIGRYRGAIAVYTEGLASFPDSFRLLRHRGHRYLNVREPELAIADLERALELLDDEGKAALEYGPTGEPTATYEHWIWYHVGLYHYLNANWMQAAEAFEHCVRTAISNRNRVGASDWLYHALAQGGELDKAQAVIDAIPADIDTDDTGYYRRVMLYKGELELADVLDVAKPVAEWSGGDMTIAYGVANWLRYQGEEATAERLHRSILESPYWGAWAYVVTDRAYARRDGVMP